MNDQSIQTADPDGPSAPEPQTRTARREEIIELWRQEMRSRVTPLRTWAALGAGYVAAMGAAMIIPDPLVLVAVAVALTIGAWIIWNRFRTRDAALLSLSRLTPVVDRSILAGEIAILDARKAHLLDAMRNPNTTDAMRRDAADATIGAALPIMARGGVSEETATVSGYPAWPEIDVTEMPGSAGDFVTIHVLRIEASVDRLIRTAAVEDAVLAETVAQMAGEIVPPARALRQALA